MTAITLLAELIGALCQGSAARYLGLIAASAGAVEEACEYFEQALAVNSALRAPACLARTQLDYAATLGQGPRAVELIEAASRTAADLDLPAIADRAARLLHN
jgi:tetratricopeptide (TPR) repeat protein